MELLIFARLVVAPSYHLSSIQTKDLLLHQRALNSATPELLIPQLFEKPRRSEW